ncbi:hypothetical protein LJ707_02260 [Mucilaginibacter sp. UR6-1]|uniref:hypothetical protein n=1 Tax=Mucilaginibacter sp. UR6-1 TaxID=1435643 RepID=UPI001E60E7A0|nr:hypothetical protein [Mucilaginibacter sp. UR6-1]MCC8407735.1 hypothetical protein [Mucilaginibacter sp. UR6-1]
MEAAIQQYDFNASLHLSDVVSKFFANHTPEAAKVMFWKLFQCWATKECTYKAEVSDEEVALFFDQLTDLVAAAYILHQANGVPENPQKGEGHD